MASYKPVNLKKIKPVMAQELTPSPKTVTIPVEDYAQLVSCSRSWTAPTPFPQPAFSRSSIFIALYSRMLSSLETFLIANTFIAPRLKRTK
jgi:hypothetical protein